MKHHIYRLIAVVRFPIRRKGLCSCLLSLSVLCRSTVINVFAFDDLSSEMSGAMLNEIVAMETEVNESEAKATEMAAKVNEMEAN